ncbi:MAG: recombinase family protein [Methylocystis sp.]|nr:recombinase family protein [Methylocystis sp.]
MTRAVVYARFSTELQNEKSTEDQIELCRGYAARLGFDVIGTHEDKALSNYRRWRKPRKSSPCIPRPSRAISRPQTGSQRL